MRSLFRFSVVVVVAVAIPSLPPALGLARSAPAATFEAPAPAGFPSDASVPNPHPPRLTSRALRSGPAPVGGRLHIPVILADFVDEPHRPEHSPALFGRLLFERSSALGEGSLRDYFDHQSGGLLDVRGEATEWLRMPHRYTDYSGSSFGYQATGMNVRTLVTDAMDAAAAQIDFCRSDSDGDGLVDLLTIVHAGPGAEEVGRGLWSLSWRLRTPASTGQVCDGTPVKVRDFIIVPERYASAGFAGQGLPPRMISIGMIAHEFGHFLGLPDLYDPTGATPGGIGTWDLMATGAWGIDGRTPWRPTPLGAWAKVKLGWAAPQRIAENRPGLSLRSIDKARSGISQEVLRLDPIGARPGEHFLLEYRSRNAWAAGFPADGFALWHVNENTAGCSESAPGGDSCRSVYLVQADGRDDLGRSGRSSALADAGDLWPGSTGAAIADPQTHPSTRAYSGVDSQIFLESMVAGGHNGTVSVYLEPRPAPPPAPSGLHAEPGKDSIALEWDRSPGEGAMSYRVYRSTTMAGGFKEVGRTDAASWVDGHPSIHGPAYYHVRAYNRGLSEPSTTVAAPAVPGATPPAPEPVRAVGPSNLQVKIGKGKRAGDRLVLKSRKRGRKHRLDYALAFKAGTAPLPETLIIDLRTIGPRFTGRLLMKDSTSGRWVRAGRIPARAQGRVYKVFSPAYRFIGTSGTVLVRIKSVHNKQRFRHVFKRARLILR